MEEKIARTEINKFLKSTTYSSFVIRQRQIRIYTHEKLRVYSIHKNDTTYILQLSPSRLISSTSKLKFTKLPSHVLCCSCVKLTVSTMLRVILRIKCFGEYLGQKY